MGLMKQSKKPAMQAQAQADQQAAQIKNDEAERQARVQQGRTGIDTTFDSRFTPGYYDDYSKSYTDYYNPQLDEKFAKTKQDLVYALARQDLLNSKAGIDKLAEADKDLAAKKVQVASEATDATNKLRSNVEKQRSALYSLNEGSADPAAATNRASAEATSLAAPVSMQPLGDVFAGLLSGLGSVVSGVNSNPYANVYGNNGPYAVVPVTGTGSSRTQG